MRFVVSSTELLSHLQAISRVISNKNTLPILDNFLFQLNEKDLKITASDLETTLITNITLENAIESGEIAIPAKILNDTLKEFSEQPLTFEIDTNSLSIVIHSVNGKFSIVGQNGSEFPQIPVVKDDVKSTYLLDAEIIYNGINRTLFATADDDLRPVMNGIFIEFKEEHLIFAASDAHKLVRYRRLDVKSDQEASFILPKKPAALLKGILPKEDNKVVLEFDDKNAFFTLTNYKMVCRLVEGNYPSYGSVIPANNPNKLTVDRLELHNSLKRVSVFSNQASNLIKLSLTGNQITVSAQDIDFSISGVETLNCQYEGDEMEIGFKSLFLIEILNNLPTSEVMMEFSDSTRAGLVLPVDHENSDEDILMLLMPMMIQG